IFVAAAALEGTTSGRTRADAESNSVVEDEDHSAGIKLQQLHDRTTARGGAQAQHQLEDVDGENNITSALQMRSRTVLAQEGPQAEVDLAEALEVEQAAGSPTDDHDLVNFSPEDENSEPQDHLQSGAGGEQEHDGRSSYLDDGAGDVLVPRLLPQEQIDLGRGGGGEKKTTTKSSTSTSPTTGAAASHIINSRPPGSSSSFVDEFFLESDGGSWTTSLVPARTSTPASSSPSPGEGGGPRDEGCSEEDEAGETGTTGGTTTRCSGIVTLKASTSSVVPDVQHRASGQQKLSTRTFASSTAAPSTTKTSLARTTTPESFLQKFFRQRRESEKQKTSRKIGKMAREEVEHQVQERDGSYSSNGDEDEDEDGHFLGRKDPKKVALEKRRKEAKRLALEDFKKKPKRRVYVASYNVLSLLQHRSSGGPDLRSMKYQLPDKNKFFQKFLNIAEKDLRAAKSTERPAAMKKQKDYLRLELAWKEFVNGQLWTRYPLTYSQLRAVEGCVKSYPASMTPWRVPDSAGRLAFDHVTAPGGKYLQHPAMCTWDAGHWIAKSQLRFPLALLGVQGWPDVKTSVLPQQVSRGRWSSAGEQEQSLSPDAYKYALPFAHPFYETRARARTWLLDGLNAKDPQRDSTRSERAVANWQRAQVVRHLAGPRHVDAGRGNVERGGEGVQPRRGGRGRGPARRRLAGAGAEEKQKPR
ncbi:unnamed protein product, partial [Amoebophrya sp. A120]